MYDAFFEERGLIPEGRLCEVGYEDLERDPVGVVGSIYEALGCRASRTSGPAWRATSARSPAIARTATTSFPSRLRRRIAHEWGRSFDEWGYGR